MGWGGRREGKKEKNKKAKSFFYIKKVNRNLQKLILKEHILLYLNVTGRNKHHLIISVTLLNELQESAQIITENSIVYVYQIYICLHILHISIDESDQNRSFLGKDQRQQEFCSTKTLTGKKKGLGKLLDLQCIFLVPEVKSGGTNTTTCSEQKSLSK